MRSDQVTGRLRSGEDFQANPKLRESDAVWIRRGQSLGAMVLTSRKYAGIGWATMLVLAGGSLVVLALLGLSEPREADVNPAINTVSASAD